MAENTILSKWLKIQLTLLSLEGNCVILRFCGGIVGQDEINNSGNKRLNTCNLLKSYDYFTLRFLSWP